MRDQPGRDARPARNLRQRASHEAKFCETINRDVDQLLTTIVLEVLTRSTAQDSGIGGSTFV